MSQIFEKPRGKVTVTKAYSQTGIFYTVIMAVLLGTLLIYAGFTSIYNKKREENEAYLEEIKQAKIEYSECLKLADQSYNAELNMSCRTRGYGDGKCPPTTIDAYLANENRDDFILTCENKYKVQLQ